MKKLFQSKIFHNFSWLLFDKLIRLVLSLFVSVVVARYLGPEQYGLWSYLLSITMFFTTFVSLGFESILPRELVKYPEKELKLISTAFTLKLIGSFIGFALNIGLFIVFKSPDKELLLMMSLMASLLIFQSLDSFDAFFKSKLQAKYSVIGRNSAFVLVALLKLYFVYADFPLIYFVATNSLEMLIGGLIVILLFYRMGNKVSLKAFDWKLGKDFLKDSFPLAISGLMVMLYMRIDQIMLTEISGERANGIYSTGVRMVEIIYFIPVALGDSFFPGLVYSKKNEGEKFDHNLLSFYSIMTWSAIAIGLATFVVAQPMMHILFGEEYAGSGDVVQIFAFSFYATFLGIATGKLLVAENYTKIILTRSFLGLLLNVVLNLFFISKYNYVGAALASLISYFMPLMTLLFFKRSRPQIAIILKALDPRYAINKILSK